MATPNPPDPTSEERHPHSPWRRAARTVAAHKVLGGTLLFLTAGACLILFVLALAPFGEEETPSEPSANRANPVPRAGRVAYTPPVPVYPVTALPGPGECSRTETAVDQGAGSAGAEVRNPTERVSFGVVKVLADGVHATGFVAGEFGLIVTHGLAVSGASGPRVEMHDGESFQARVVSIDNGSGLAYVEVRADRDLTPVSLGNSDEVCVGDNVIALGYSRQGETESLKALHGQVTTARDGYFRIDSSLNDEILGGPLLNDAGVVIGVSGSGSGIVIQDGVAAKIVSFVIPINIVKGHLSDGLPEATAAPADNLALFPTRTPPPPATPLPSPAPPPSPTVVIPTPTPSPTPFPTATPTPPPTPAQAPTATATPLPQPSATPTPTATPRATTVPRPTPRIRPTVRPTSTPTPTATPSPTPVPLPTASYRNSTLGYSISYPLGWDVNPERNDKTVNFTSPESDAYIEVSVEDVFSDWSLGEFVDHYRQGLGSQARSWEVFNQVTATGEYRESTNYVHLEYRRQRQPDSCVEDVVTHMYRSRYFPARMTGYAVIMSICDYSLEEYSETRETVLSGFREFQTE